MIFFTFFTYFVALVSASAIAKGHGRSSFGQLMTRQPINDCEPTFNLQDHTDANSPTIADCDALVAGLDDNTNLVILNGERRTVSYYKTCRFEIQSESCEDKDTIECRTNPWIAKVGNEDIAAAVWGAMDLARKTGTAGEKQLVAATGVFNCEVVLGEPAHVKWFLFKDPYFGVPVDPNPWNGP